MKKVSIKYFSVVYGLVLLLLITSCIKDMEITIPDLPEKVVACCLFNPKDNWELTLSNTKTVNNTNESYIENATVEITSDSGEIISLNYKGKGVYAANSNPEVGETYTLKINIPGYDEITAQSRIPFAASVQVEDIKFNWIKYLYPNDLLDYDVFPLTIHFEQTVEKAHFLFRAHHFNPEYGYTRYMLTSASLKKLEEAGLLKEAAIQLLEFVDKWQVHPETFTDCLNVIDDWDTRIRYYNILESELKKKNITQHEYEAFLPSECFEDDNWLNNISYDTYTIIGNGENITKADLLYADANLNYSMENNKKRNEEYWLEVTQGDSNYLEYYRTYILQVSQRINPYSEPVQVFSNINNATGIFAGYNRQMIHLFNY
jgi:hypothetical protein